MFEIIYSLFFVVLVAEVIVFLFLTLPTPKGWKGAVVNFLNTNPSVKTLRNAHLGFCVIAALFYWDSLHSEGKFKEQKEQAKAGDSIGSELKSNYYSYLNLKSQRNTYIAGMLIYVSVALNIYVMLLNYMYQKRAKHEAELSLKLKQAETDRKNKEQAEKPQEGSTIGA